MQLKIKGKKWNFFLDRTIKRSFTDFYNNEIRVKNEFDILHELLHAILHEDFAEKDWDKDMEEYFVSTISKSLEMFMLENLEKIIQVVDLTKVDNFSITKV